MYEFYIVPNQILSSSLTNEEMNEDMPTEEEVAVFFENENEPFELTFHSIYAPLSFPFLNPFNE